MLLHTYNVPDIVLGAEIDQLGRSKQTPWQLRVHVLTGMVGNLQVIARVMLFQTVPHTSVLRTTGLPDLSFTSPDPFQSFAHTGLLFSSSLVKSQLWGHAGQHWLTLSQLLDSKSLSLISFGHVALSETMLLIYWGEYNLQIGSFFTEMQVGKWFHFQLVQNAPTNYRMEELFPTYLPGMSWRIF